MSEKFRGNSPSRTKKVYDPSAEEAGKKAQEAFLKRNAKSAPFMTKYGYHVVIGGFVALVLIAFGNALFSKSRNPDVTPVIEEDEIAAHNASGNTFQLGANDHFSQWMLSDAKNIMNTSMTARQNLVKCASAEDSSIIPTSYNFREEYPNCARDVASQDKCAASYAFTVSGSIADRMCQQSGKVVDLSAQPLISCNKGLSMGCQGGYISTGFDYAKNNGLPENSCMQYTGNDSDEGCAGLNDCEKHKIQDQCVASEEEGIKREIFQNGPVIAVIPVYRDFLVYKSGIYQVLDSVSTFKSGTAVKIIGWGVEESTNKNYWIIENSWGASWGEQGFARVYTNQPLYLDEQALAPVLVNNASAQAEEQQQQ